MKVPKSDFKTELDIKWNYNKYRSLCMCTTKMMNIKKYYIKFYDKINISITYSTWAIYSKYATSEYQKRHLYLLWLSSIGTRFVKFFVSLLVIKFLFPLEIWFISSWIFFKNQDFILSVRFSLDLISSTFYKFHKITTHNKE